ncbi:hypothetical protein C7S20_19285 [Christiangramia fulva]|uniref:Uncharacterized protein n=1 Tax=Christiangramia fulva TaxID=2126553 RepID=A0A2R3ZAM6_9FLAO|nr:hypothetical protein [Christiangramia fulva]AVR47222.1 hypothetical protein C7S20_19285 [Christiangramia fulva]
MGKDEKTKNPFAFPVTDGETFCQDGMTLRDYFAAKAMQALIDQPIMVGNTNATEILAKQSYIVADAMLKERES